MKITFIVPPCFDHKQPAERTAGCTRVVYLAPNIYELSVAAVLQQQGHDVTYRDFVYHKTSQQQFDDFFASDDSDIYFIWTVNLSITTDINAIQTLRRYRKDATVVMLGPGPLISPAVVLSTKTSSSCEASLNIL